MKQTILMLMVGLLLGAGSVEAAKTGVALIKGTQLATIHTIETDVSVYKVVDGGVSCYVTITDGLDYTVPNISCVK